MNQQQPPVGLALDVLGVPHQIFRHDGPISSLEQAAEERNQRPEQVVRSILFRLSKGEYFMVLMAGPAQISWSALRAYLGRSRLTTASREEVLQVTGYQLGAVAPFGLPTETRTGLRILIDESVLAQEEISLGSGVRGTAIIMKSADLLPALGGAEVGRFRKANKET
jgi:prolyl-tRNA editing enzyme YbaK/EbsC (Cys-tRNA(Pro) deacylase)